MKTIIPPSSPMFDSSIRPPWAYGIAALATLATAAAAVVDISGEINIDSVVGAGNSARMIDNTKTLWSSANVTVPINLNGFELLVDSGSGNALNLASPLSGNGSLNFIGGPWWGGAWNTPIYVSGSTGSSYTGATNVLGGLTVLNKSAGDALSGSITVGDTSVQDNATGNARIMWEGSNQLADDAMVTVLTSLHPSEGGNSDNNTYLDLNGFSDMIGSLTLEADAVPRVRTGDGGVLTVGELYLEIAGSLVPQSEGAYTASSHPMWISGTGSLVVIPEPGVALLSVVGLLSLLRRRRAA